MESSREKGEGGGGRGGRLLNKALFGEASKGTPFVYLPLKSCTLYICFVRINR